MLIIVPRNQSPQLGDRQPLTWNAVPRLGESVSLVRKELSGHADLHAVFIRVRFPLDLHIEIDRAHDAIAELFFDQRLPGCPIGLDEFMKTVDERFLSAEPSAANHDKEVRLALLPQPR